MSEFDKEQARAASDSDSDEEEVPEVRNMEEKKQYILLYYCNTFIISIHSLHVLIIYVCIFMVV